MNEQQNYQQPVYEQPQYQQPQYQQPQYQQPVYQQAYAAPVSQFTGGLLGLIGINILQSLIIMFTLGIGNLWLSPYKQAAYAAFYRDVTMPVPQLEL